MSDGNQTNVPESVKDAFSWIGTIKSSFASLISDGAKITVGIVDKAITITLEAVDGKSWDQIAGKLFGMALDVVFVGKIGKINKVKTYFNKMEYGSFKQTFIEGAVVFSIEKTDYSASNYFEKTFPKAKEFYTRIATDREYAKSVWEGLKATTDVDQFTNYYKNVSLDEFINDFKELFSSNSSVPNLNYGLEVKEDTAKVIAPKNSQEEQIIIEDILKNRNEIKEVEVQGTTYNIKSLSNLQIRNALDFIPKVSFLLSNILIKVGEELDLGDKGIYKVKSGDTLSVIVQKHGMVTKDLVKLNPWLCDEGRIKFNQNKVLIEGNPLNLSNTNHTLYGEANAENVLIDANGGDNIFIGGYKKDIMQSKGKGYDIYHANDGDEITDNDGKGKVIFNNTTLTGGTYDKEKDCYVNGDIEYHLNGKILTIKQGKESLTIKNFNKDNKDLGITLLDQGEISITISDNEKAEGDNGEQSMNFNIKVNGEIPKGEYAIININGQEYLIGTPNPKYNIDTSKYKRTLTYTHKWQGNEEKEEDKKFAISGSVVKSSQGLKVKEIISGNGTIIDDDKDDKQDPEDVNPIIIDLNKNKITSTKLNNTIYFDHNNNNFKEATSWIDKGDAFLALDKNSNGLIDNGNELFGNHTISNTKYGEKEANNKDTSINGYEALKAYDLNGDNVIDSKDEIYDKLLLWKDFNQNAITDKGSTTIANDVWFK